MATSKEIYTKEFGDNFTLWQDVQRLKELLCGLISTGYLSGKQWYLHRLTDDPTATIKKGVIVLAPTPLPLNTISSTETIFDVNTKIPLLYVDNAYPGTGYNSDLYELKYSGFGRYYPSTRSVQYPKYESTKYVLNNVDISGYSDEVTEYIVKEEK